MGLVLEICRGGLKCLSCEEVFFLFLVFDFLLVFTVWTLLLLESPDHECHPICKAQKSHKPLMNAFHDRKPRPKKTWSCLIYSPFEISTTMKESAIHDTWMLSLHMWVIVYEMESFFSWKKREGDEGERRNCRSFFLSSRKLPFRHSIYRTTHGDVMCLNSSGYKIMRIHLQLLN